ncbi:MAG TPA: hypothetical protein VFO16_02075, partial [Pseudonocardiaceae bacterium]|nr:hypothetical protein [Pseudonocardiaceae bacterium]
GTAVPATTSGAAIPAGAVPGCRRDVPLKNNYSRLCWSRAGPRAANPPAVTEADLAGVTCHQLFFAGTTKMRGPRSSARHRAAPQYVVQPKMWILQITRCARAARSPESRH